jgi:hypothetical protein
VDTAAAKDNADAPLSSSSLRFSMKIPVALRALGGPLVMVDGRKKKGLTIR